MTKFEKTPELETLVDIAWLAGAKRFHSGNSRDDIDTIIRWANEFNAAWVQTDTNDYMEDIEDFALKKLADAPTMEN
jgi:hypothetical protein